MRAKQSKPEISMATVYNSLDALVKCGVVRQVNVDRGATLFCSNMGEHAHFCQHGGMSLGAEDVLAVHAPVEIHAGGEFLNELIGGFAEAAAPEFVLLLVGHRTVPMHKAGFARRAV